MFKEFNAHPKGIKTNDCVVRAIATATNSDYFETRRRLNNKKRELGFASYRESKFLYAYLKDYPRLIFKPIKGEPRIKGKDFVLLYPKGNYILKMAGHVVACVDGTLIDTWDCSDQSVYTAWEINKDEYSI
ncbi:MAG: hypothetical protein UMR38_06380 [Candidatus Izemoplasma sp.]|nr:hypothetical protein [Candidatus Izemoplasma sp.]